MSNETAVVEDPTLPDGARPDEFFTADQIRRLTELMAKWRLARDHGGPWSDAEDQELHALINDEILATIPRARKLRAEGKL
jgi:hypothetical protein